MKFTIDKDNKNRLIAFSDVCKKIETFCPLSNKNIFFINVAESQLEIYGIGDSSGGGAGQVAIKIDISSIQGFNTHFITDLLKFVSVIKKVRGDTVDVSLDDRKLTFVNPSKPKNIITLNTINVIDDDEIKEIREYIDEKLKEDEFSNTTKVVLTSENKSILSTLSDTTKLLDVNDSVEVGKTEIKAADNICIIAYKTPASIVDKNIMLNRNISSIFSDITEMEVSNSGKYVFLNLAAKAIKVLFQPRLPRYQYPTEAELKSIIPLNTYNKKITLKTKDFFESLEQFSGVFDTDNWRYEQAKIDIVDNEFVLFFDDMASEVKEFIEDIEITTTGKVGDECNMVIPFLHVNKLKSLFGEETTITINDIQNSEPNGMTILMESGNLRLVLGKLLA
jgi:hypothetical protein